jgi:hypothetical protein
LGNRAEILINLAARFREHIQAGIEGVSAEMKIPELKKKQIEVRKKIVQAIIKRIEIDDDKNLSIDVVIELPKFFSISEPETRRHCC